jgi:hypothetical protein
MKATKQTYLDWVNKGCPIDLDDENRNNPQHLRAQELLELEYLPRAFAILNCCSWVCRDRMCPRCTVFRSRDYLAKVIAAVRFMKNPVLALFKLDSEKMKARSLEEALDLLPKSIRAMRRRPPFRKVKCAIGCIEVVPVRTSTGKHIRWNVHSHLIFDRPTEGFSEKIARLKFRRLADSPNTQFGVQEIGNKKALIAYITKPYDVCPDPGALPLWELEQFMVATKNRQFLISWGISRRGKNRSGRSLTIRRRPLAKNSARGDQLAQTGNPRARQKPTTQRRDAATKRTSKAKRLGLPLVVPAAAAARRSA